MYTFLLGTAIVFAVTEYREPLCHGHLIRLLHKVGYVLSTSSSSSPPHVSAAAAAASRLFTHGVPGTGRRNVLRGMLQPRRRLMMVLRWRRLTIRWGL